MTATKQFIEDAIKGGWHLGHAYDVLDGVRVALLDPLAWQAVGKTRGWKKETTWYSSAFPEPYLARCHHFIDHLADGLTIEEALSRIDPHST